MKKNKPRKNNQSLFRKLLYAFLALSLVLFVGAVQTSQSVTSRASETGGIQSLIPPPSLRLVVPSHIIHVGEKLPVDVYADTGGAGSVESRIVVHFDASAFRIAAADVKPTTLYHAVNVEPPQTGTLEASFFNTPEAGYGLVSTAGERKVATLMFTAVGTADRSSISLAYDGTNPELSGIFVPGDEGTGNARNILRDVLGSTVSVIR